jgi:hypothetical protein
MRGAGRAGRDGEGRGGLQGAGHEPDARYGVDAPQGKSRAAISSADGRITWRSRPKCEASRTVRGYFAAPVSYRRCRSRNPCAAMTATSWCSASPSRKTRRPLPSASLGRGCLPSLKSLQRTMVPSTRISPAAGRNSINRNCKPLRRCRREGAWKLLSDAIRRLSRRGQMKSPLCRLRAPRRLAD